MSKQKNPRTVPLKSSWVTWLEDMIRVLVNEGVLCFPSAGVAYQIDKEARTLTLVIEHPMYDHEGQVAVLTERCAAALGYRVVYLDSPARTPNALDKLVKGHGLQTPALAEAVGERLAGDMLGEGLSPEQQLAVLQALGSRVLTDPRLPGLSPWPEFDLTLADDPISGCLSDLLQALGERLAAGLPLARRVQWTCHGPGETTTRGVERWDDEVVDSIRLAAIKVKIGERLPASGRVSPPEGLRLELLEEFLDQQGGLLVEVCYGRGTDRIKTFEALWTGRDWDALIDQGFLSREEGEELTGSNKTSETL